LSSRQYPDKLTFQSRSLTTQPGGQVTESFATAFSRFGKVEQTGANEGTKNDQQQNVEGYRIRLPRDTTAAAITAKWRIVWRDQLNVTRTLNLTGVDAGQSGRTAELHLTATLTR
jgi:head-tail adaptor